jgi:tRNA A-37 threonylcarbamoyl transferase component Bud32
MEKGDLIGRGRTADIYRWGSERVLKLYKEDMPGHVVQQEYNLTRAACTAGLPVPETYELVEIDGLHGIIFKRLEGPSLLNSIAMHPWKMVAHARQLAELHVRIHACVALPELPSQRQAVEKAIISSQDLSQALKEKILARLAVLPEGNALCHGDFHPDNILMTARGPVIIDWMTATRGNPLADVCRTSILLQTGGLPAGAPLHMRVLLPILRFMLEEIYFYRYTQLCPASRQQVAAWQIPLMAARLREVGDYPDEKQQLLTRIRAGLNG